MGIWWKRANRPGAVAGMMVGLAITLLYMVGSRFYGMTWWGTATVASGVFGIPLGFVTIYVVSLLTAPPPERVQELVSSVRYPKATVSSRNSPTSGGHCCLTGPGRLARSSSETSWAPPLSGGSLAMEVLPGVLLILRTVAFIAVCTWASTSRRRDWPRIRRARCWGSSPWSPRRFSGPPERSPAPARRSEKCGGWRFALAAGVWVVTVVLDVKFGARLRAERRRCRHRAARWSRSGTWSKGPKRCTPRRCACTRRVGPWTRVDARTREGITMRHAMAGAAS